MMPSIVVRKNLIIFRKPHEWQLIKDQLIQEHGARIGISWVMRRELGFTVRRHQALVPTGYQRDGKPDMRYQDQIHLDFFNQSTQTWFQLRYLNL
jgi:hypothetical protein